MNRSDTADAAAIDNRARALAALARIAARIAASNPYPHSPIPTEETCPPSSRM